MKLSALPGYAGPWEPRRPSVGLQSVPVSVLGQFVAKRKHSESCWDFSATASVFPMQCCCSGMGKELVVLML